MTTGLTFNEKAHKYRLDGKPVPGVTTLIGKGLPKPALTYWSAKMVAEFVADRPDEVDVLRGMGREPMVQALKSVPWEKRDQAAIRGTDVHALAERLLHGNEAEVPPHLIEYVNAYVRWLDEWQPTPIVSERPCASREYQVAGKFDAIFTLPSGERVLADWKTSIGVYGDTSAQLAAYRGMEFYLGEDDAEHSMPEVDTLAVLHITPAGCDFYRVADPAAAWADWLHISAVAKAVDRIKGQLGEPSPTPVALAVA